MTRPSVQPRPRPSTQTPAQLPASAAGMLRRPVAQDRLDELAVSGDASTVLITAIGGMGGIGKTTLAVKWAHEVAHRYPDGQLYINLRGFDAGGRAVPPAEALATLLTSIGIVPATAETGVEEVRSAQYRTAMSGRRRLILLDNARDAEQVRPLLPGTAGSLVIVTSRNRLASLVIHEGAVPIQLDRMTDQESREVLRSRLGHERTLNREQWIVWSRSAPACRWLCPSRQPASSCTRGSGSTRSPTGWRPDRPRRQGIWPAGPATRARTTSDRCSPGRSIPCPPRLLVCSDCWPSTPVNRCH